MSNIRPLEAEVKTNKNIIDFFIVPLDLKTNRQEKQFRKPDNK